MDLDPTRYSEADRRAVDPPVRVETATWEKAGQLDWWVKEHRPRLEWLGRVRGADGRQRWIKAVDLRPRMAHSHEFDALRFAKSRRL
jgi:hypothetical protein